MLPFSFLFFRHKMKPKSPEVSWSLLTFLGFVRREASTSSCRCRGHRQPHSGFGPGQDMTGPTKFWNRHLQNTQETRDVVKHHETSMKYPWNIHESPGCSTNDPPPWPVQNAEYLPSLRGQLGWVLPNLQNLLAAIQIRLKGSTDLSICSWSFQMILQHLNEIAPYCSKFLSCQSLSKCHCALTLSEFLCWDKQSPFKSGPDKNNKLAMMSWQGLQRVQNTTFEKTKHKKRGSGTQSCIIAHRTSHGVWAKSCISVETNVEGRGWTKCSRQVSSAGEVFDVQARGWRHTETQSEDVWWDSTIKGKTMGLWSPALQLPGCAPCDVNKCQWCFGRIQMNT